MAHGAPPASPKPASKGPLAKSTAKPPAKGASAASADGTGRASQPPSDEDRGGVGAGADAPELRELAAAERELFRGGGDAFRGWPHDAPPAGESRARFTGLPAPRVSEPPKQGEGGRDLSWLASLRMPDLPVVWDGKVVRYLEFFKSDRRGRRMFALWLKRSGRYRDLVARALRKKSMPEDLFWLSMIESGFDPTIRSPAGAVGLWQFMPQTGRLYGLHVDRWLDERMSPPASTDAAVDFLAELHRRFGSWELAMAGYNMGYGGLLRVVRHYNSNDYWALSKLEGSLPWETTLYVPKIVAVAIVAKNLDTFGFTDVTREPPVDFEEVAVPPGTALAVVAKAAQVPEAELSKLNPELRAKRTPPKDAGVHHVRVPLGTGEACAAALVRLRATQTPLDRITVQFGESLEQVARRAKTTVEKLSQVNAIAADEKVGGGDVLLVPRSGAEIAAAGKGAKAKADDATSDDEKPVVVVPQDVFVYPDRRRVFYRVAVGDTVHAVASAFKVTVDELRKWNDIDPAAHLVDGMTLQLFVSDGAATHASTRVVSEKDVRVIPVGTDAFFTHWEDKGRSRVVIAAKEGETLGDIGKRFGLSPASMERINRRGRTEKLSAGETVVVYAAPGRAKSAPHATTAQAAAAPGRAGETLPPSAPPKPENLPPLP